MTYPLLGSRVFPKAFFSFLIPRYLLDMQLPFAKVIGELRMRLRLGISSDRLLLSASVIEARLRQAFLLTRRSSLTLSVTPFFHALMRRLKTLET